MKELTVTVTRATQGAQLLLESTPDIIKLFINITWELKFGSIKNNPLLEDVININLQ